METTIGERIKKYRSQAGLSLQQVGDKMGVSRQLIQQYESGQSYCPTLSTIERLAQALNISPAVLVGWENESPETQALDAICKGLQRILDRDVRRLNPPEAGSFGENLKGYRERIGMSIAELAKRAHVSPAQIYTYEEGGVDSAKPKVVVRLAEALKVTPSALYGWQDSVDETELNAVYGEIKNILESVNRFKISTEEKVK